MKIKQDDPESQQDTVKNKVAMLEVVQDATQARNAVMAMRVRVSSGTQVYFLF